MLPNKNNTKKQYTVTPFNATNNEIGKICAICGNGILNDESVVLCPECNLPYHHDCWKEMGGCGSYGCAAAPNIKKAEYAPSDSYVAGWTSEKKCPECGSMILSNALICRVCKSEFPTEKPMTKEQWNNRIYDGKDIIMIRTIVIIQFLLSLIICFDPLLFFANIYTIFFSKNYWWFFKINRLPNELKILHYAGTVISGINILIGIALFITIKAQAL